MITRLGILSLKFHNTVCSRAYNTFGVSLARVIYSIWLASFYFQSLEVRDFVWGDQGPISHYAFLGLLKQTSGLSLLAISPAPLWRDLLLLVGLASAFFLLFGVRSRINMILSLTILVSFQQRNYFILNGGDHIGRLILILLATMYTDDYFCIQPRTSKKKPLGILCHNIGLLAVTFQLCILYGFTGYSKVVGSLWQNGTALYYVLQSTSYAHPVLGSYCSGYLHVMTLGTYLTIAVECAFPFLVWTRHYRTSVIVVMALLHLGIASLMGLMRFSLAMWGALAMLLGDREWPQFRSGWLVPLRDRLESLPMLKSWIGGYLRGTRVPR